MMKKMSARWLCFVAVLTMFWVIAPLWVITRFTGPIGAPGLLISLAFLWFAFPKVNAWLVVHTPFGRLCAWARR